MAVFRYRDPNPARTNLVRQKISGQVASELELEVWAALDAVQRGLATNRQVNTLIGHVGAAQVLWAGVCDKGRYEQSLESWRLLCACALADEDAPLHLTSKAYEAVRRTITTYARNLTKFTIGEVRGAIDFAMAKAGGALD